MTSSLPRVKYGAAHYKCLEQDITNALKIWMLGCHGDFIFTVYNWCLAVPMYNNINCSKNNITKCEPVIEISSDASSFGWGAVCNNIRTGWAFSLDEMQYHTNAKELLAANYSIKTFVKYLMPFLSCFQTTLLLYMALTICTLINLICVISLYLKFGLALWTKSFALLLPTFKKRRTMMQMRNHAKSKLNWNGCLTKKFSQELFLSLNFNQR